MLRRTAASDVAAVGRYVRLADDDVTVAAVIIGTAEYCSEVVGALGRNVAKLLDPPLGDQVGTRFRFYPTVCFGAWTASQHRP